MSNTTTQTNRYTFTDEDMRKILQEVADKSKHDLVIDVLSTREEFDARLVGIFGKDDLIFNTSPVYDFANLRSTVDTIEEAQAKSPSLHDLAEYAMSYYADVFLVMYSQVNDKLYASLSDVLVDTDKCHSQETVYNTLRPYFFFINDAAEQDAAAQSLAKVIIEEQQ